MVRSQEQVAFRAEIFTSDDDGLLLNAVVVVATRVIAFHQR
jgi:hypothetical protein